MSDITFPPELDAPGHVFLTGSAGTGKTTLIRQWVEARRRTLDIAIVAPTGVGDPHPTSKTTPQLPPPTSSPAPKGRPVSESVGNMSNPGKVLRVASN